MSVLACNLTLSLARSLLLLSLFGLALNPLSAFQESTTQKTKYEFTDNRVLEADSLLKKRKYQEALEAYKTAYDQFEKESFYEGMVYVQERMGRAFRSLGRDSLSQVTYKTAIKLSRDKLGPNHILESKVFVNSGMAAHFNDEPLTASKLLDSAMWTYERASHQDSTILKSIIDFKFYSYYYSNLSRDTLIKYLNERARYYEVSNPSISDEIYLLGDYSRAFYRLGDFHKSAAYGLEATRISEIHRDEIDMFYYTDAYFNLGRALMRQNDFLRALDVASKLVEFTLKEDPDNRDLRGYYNLKAVALSSLGRYEDAASEFIKIIDILESRGIRSEFYRSTIMNLGVCYSLMGEHVLAEEFLLDALRKEKNDNNSLKITISDRYKYLSQNFERKNDYQTALYYLDSAINSNLLAPGTAILDFPSTAGININFEILSLIKDKQLMLNKVFLENHPDSVQLLQASIDYVERAHELLMANRKQLIQSEGKLFLSENFKDMYEGGLEAIYSLVERNGADNGLMRKAFKFMGWSKSILFLEQSDELGQIQSGHLDPAMIEEYFDLNSSIDRLEQLFNDKIDEISTNDSIRMINSELLVLNQSLEELKLKISEISDLDVTKIDFEFLVFDEIQSMPGCGLVEFFFGQNHLYVLGVSENSNALNRVLLNSSFNDNFNEVLLQLTSRPDFTDYTNLLTKYNKSSSDLYFQVIGRTLDDLENDIEKLTIIPDGDLSKLSFEALVVGSKRELLSFNDFEYLVDKYNVNYALSSSRLIEEKNERAAKKKLFGIGFSGKDFGETRSDFGDLPGTEEEINFLKASFEGDFYLGNEGTKGVFLDVAKDYDVLHLAIHGEADSEDRYQSRLIFNGEDNVLKTSDLYRAGLKARLAILSACESGVGKVNRGEGTFSIARGFSLVGVSSIVMSLWKVNDRISADLMVSYHKNLQEGLNSRDALSQTKRDYIMDSDKYTSHPYYWSAFVSLGDEVSLSSESIDAYLIIIALILSILTVAFIVYKKRKEANRPLL